MNLFNYFKEKIIKHLIQLAKQDNIIINNYGNFTILLLKNTDLGDIATNVAFIYCKSFNLPACKLALKLTTILSEDQDIKALSAKNGFINITLKENIWYNIFTTILLDAFTPLPSCKPPQKININFNEDINKLEDLSASNLAFYLPYTYARISSIITNTLEIFPHINLAQTLPQQNFALLNNEFDLYIIKILALWPKILEDYTLFNDPYRIITYLKNFADYFHTDLKKSRINHNNKYIIENNFELTTARCFLARAAQIIMKNAFTILNINAIEQI